MPMSPALSPVLTKGREGRGEGDRTINILPLRTRIMVQRPSSFGTPREPTRSAGSQAPAQRYKTDSACEQTPRQFLCAVLLRKGCPRGRGQ